MWHSTKATLQKQHSEEFAFLSSLRPQYWDLRTDDIFSLFFLFFGQCFCFAFFFVSFPRFFGIGLLALFPEVLVLLIALGSYIRLQVLPQHRGSASTREARSLNMESFG